MKKHPYIVFIIQSLVLLFIQAILLNHIRLFAYFTPIIFLYPLFKLPLRTPKWMSVLLASSVGFALDLLMNTPGLNMTATTVVGLVRTPLLKSLIDEDLLDEEELEVMTPSNATLTIRKYQFYLILITLIQIALLMLVEAFSMDIYLHVLPNIVGSTIISYIIFLLFDAFLIRKKNTI